jgi:hypothetical protein
MGFRKGDRVCTTVDGETYHCTVKRGGKNIQAVVDGGNLVVKAPAINFKPSEATLKVDEPSCMDKWSIKQYKVLDGHDDCESFSCQICLKKEPIALAYNSGHGGSNEYRAMGRDNNENLDQFHEDCKEWGKQFESQFSFELDSLWLDWKQYQAPYNVTAKEYLKR